MNDLKLAKDSLQLAKKDLGLEEVIDLAEDAPFDQLHAFLTRQIQYLIDHDFGRLINAMYRIDIQEMHVKEILEKSEPGKIAANLALRVIEREKLKVITRMRYTCK